MAAEPVRIFNVYYPWRVLIMQDSARKVSGFWLISLIGRTLELTGEEE
jgi:hypothetical protein